MPGFLKHGLVGPQDGGLDLADRHGHELVVAVAFGGHGVEHLALDGGVEIGRQVNDVLVGPVVGDRRTTPAQHQRRRVAGADGGADLLFVGIVGEGFVLDLRIRIGFVPILEGLLDAGPSAVGQGPYGGVRAGGLGRTASWLCAAGRDGHQGGTGCDRRSQPDRLRLQCSFHLFLLELGVTSTTTLCDFPFFRLIVQPIPKLYTESALSSK